MFNLTAEQVIKELKLIPLPEEGGFFFENYRSDCFIESRELGKRTECTAIYYLVTPESFSGLHWVDQNEIFHFYAGNSVEMFQITQDGQASKVIIGSDILKGERPQVIVPRKAWQGTKLLDPKPGSWALLGCTVAPGFEYENFHIESREQLVSRFPDLKEDIIRFTNF